MFNNLPPVIKNLLIINFLVYFAGMVLKQYGIDITSIFGLHYFQADSFKAYQLITYMFLHSYGSFQHILFNMFGLFMFGRVLEQVWGPKRFLQYYMITGIGAGLIQMVVYYVRIKSLESGLDPETINLVYREGMAALEQGKNFSDPILGKLNLMINTSTIGASGAVFGILLAFGMLFPNTEMFLMFIPVPIKAKYMVIGYGVIELFQGIARTGSDVAHFAHLGGMLIGFILIRYWRKSTNHFY